MHACIFFVEKLHFIFPNPHIGFSRVLDKDEDMMIGFSVWTRMLSRVQSLNVDHLYTLRVPYKMLFNTNSLFQK